MICHFLWTQIVENISISVYKPSFSIWIKVYCFTCAVTQIVIIMKLNKAMLENFAKRKQGLKQSIQFLTELCYQDLQ